jgi:DNA-binding response OmpR family regulator
MIGLKYKRQEGAMAAEQLERPSILCVDDDAETRAVLGQLLSDYRIELAQNAFEALRNANGRPFHAYLLDYWLPDWSGPSLCREVRKMDPHAPIIFCTAAARDADRARALRAGANAYLCKPLDPNMLRGKLRTLLTLAQMESLQAKLEEERVVQEELERRLADTRQRLDNANNLIASSIERTARSRAFKAFMEARGTRAHFDAWWPTVFGSARANREDVTT